MTFRVLAVVAAFFAALSPVSAGNDGLTFSIYLYGFKLGYLRLEVAETDSRYAAAGRVATTGLMAKIATFEFDGKVRGDRTASKYWPEDYAATIVRKSEKTTVRMSYRDRTPKILEYTPERAPRPDDVDPAKQKGAVDLITSAYMFLRDVPREQLCDKTIQMYDGRRRSQIRQEKPMITGDQARCPGFYQRIAGFSEGEMKEKTVFPFMLYYTRQENGEYRLVSIETDSVVGSAKMVRED